MSPLKIEIELPRREKREPGEPKVWNMLVLMTPYERELLEPVQHPHPLEGVFGPSIYGFPVSWR